MIPKKLSQVQKIMDTLSYTVHYAQDIYEPSIAYTNARTNSFAGDIYKIYVNNKDSELANFLYLHECGHIIFAHSRNMNLRLDSFLQAKLHAAYKKLSHLFPDEKNYYKYFTQVLFNSVMDFEVNSRLFDNEEWNYMQNKIRRFYRNPTSRGLWPEDFGLPKGLTWNAYLNLIFLNPEEFFTKYRFFMAKTNEKTALKSKRETPSLSQEEYENFKKEWAGKQLTEEEIKKLEEEAKDHNDSLFSIPTGSNGQSKKDSKPVNIRFSEYKPQKALLSEVKKLLQTRNLHTFKRDILYNENRHKLNTGVVVPKSIKMERHCPPKLYLLIDVSGSVDASLVNDFLNTFKEISVFYSATRVITWDTQLVEDWAITENSKHIYGGGTNIASGIRYINKKYVPEKKDILFVISDFMDDMTAWKAELQKVKSKKYAINWKPGYSNAINPGFIKILKGITV